MKSPIDQIILSYKCPIDWDSMEGDQFKRYCNQCELNVYNLSTLPKSKSEKLFQDNEGSCVKFYLRADGTIKTGACKRLFQNSKRKLFNLRNSAAIVILCLVSSITNGLKQPGLAQQIECIKNKWQGKQRKYDPDATKGLMGRPVIGELRTVIEKLTSAPEVHFDSRNEVSLLKDFKQDIEKTKSINSEFVLKLKKASKDSSDDNFRFLVLYLEALLAEENPGMKVEEKSRIISSFENYRAAIQSQLLNEAEELKSNGKYDDAIGRVSSFWDMCTKGQVFSLDHYSLPENQKRWFSLDVHPYSWSLSNCVATSSKANLQRAMGIFDSKPKIPLNYSEQSALIAIKWCLLNDSAESKSTSETTPLKVFLEASLKNLKSPANSSYYLAKFKSHNLKPDSLDPNQFELTLKYQLMRALQGKDLCDINEDITAMKLVDKKSNETVEENTIDWKKWIPESNSQWIILLRVDQKDVPEEVYLAEVFPKDKTVLEFLKRYGSLLFSEY